MRNRFLGGVSFLPFFAPPVEAGAGGAVGGAGGGEGAGGGAAPGAGAPAAKPGEAGAQQVGEQGAGGAAKPGEGGGQQQEKKPGATIADGGAAPGITAQAKWPDNWRAEMAGDDKAYLKVLERYDSPAAVAKAHRELATKMSSGELKAPAKPLAADATPEQKAAWRTEQGLPADGAAYVAGVKLPNGIVPGEADKPLIEGFINSVAAEKGWTQDQVNDAIAWHMGEAQKQVQAREKADGEFKNGALVTLGQEWGKDFAGNQNAVASAIALLPEGIRDRLLTARTPDGRILGDDPEFNRGMLLLAKTMNPAAALLPNTGGNGLTGVESKIGEHEANMRAPQGTPAWDKYWRSETAQAELRQLYGARDTMKERQKPAA